MRSRSLWTFSADLICLSTDMGVVGIPFGLLFTVTGLTCIAIIPFVIFQPTPIGIWRLLLFVPLAVLIGCAHVFGGVVLLWRQRSTLDRKRRTISTRDGWLGMKIHRLSLDHFPSICVRRVKRPWFYYSPLDTLFCISLVANDGEGIAVGYAATHQLATDIENELRCFLGNTVSIPDDQNDSARSTQSATNNPMNPSGESGVS